MSAQENLFRKICTLYASAPQGFSTQDCESLLPVSRSVISHYLNRLCDEGKLRKENTRPVRFHLVEDRDPQIVEVKQDIFGSFIGAQGSLLEQINLCRAAVNYPHGGLPMLLIGESGVGKSYLANMIHRYAIEQKVIDKNSPLIELNCADYANNPELLSGTLFGYTKGAFTGADREKNGLLDQANGGFLFLDEVHRLSAENQEKLFIFMDKSYFFRLGDNSKKHQSQVRFLFATTENPEDVLLTTFRRRIPIRAELPSFNQRPIIERIALIEGFLRQEALQLDKDISISHSLMKKLIDSNVRGNVGEIKNQIKVLCAEAWNQVDVRENVDTLNLTHLRNEAINNTTESILIQRQDKKPDFHTTGRNLGLLFNDSKILVEFCQSGNTNLFLRKLELTLGQNYGETALYANENSFLWHQSNLALNSVEQVSGIDLNGDLRRIIWLALCYVIHQEKNNSATDELITSWNGWTSQRARMLAEECVDNFAKEGIACHFTLLHAILSTLLNSYVEADDMIQVVIVSHGISTASSIAGTVNRLVGGYYIKAFDMPFSISTKDIIEILIKHLDEIKNDSGLIILVDMGSLNEIYREIRQNLHSDLLVMNNVTTSMALDISTKIQSRMSMSEIVDSIKGAYEVEARYYRGVVKGNKIIISCISGEGISRKLQEIISSYITDPSIDISTMEYDDLKWKINNKESALIGTSLVITTTNLEGGIIPVVNVQQLLREKSNNLWADYFHDLLSQQELQRLIDDIVKMFTMEGIVSHLQFLNPAVIIDEVDLIIKNYESYYSIHFESYIRINLFMHISAMIERLMINETLHHRDDYPLNPQQQIFIDMQDEILRAVIQKYKLSLSKSEVLMIYELIEPWIHVQR